MRTKIVDCTEVKTVFATTGTKEKWPTYLLLLLSVAFGASGCTDYYGNPGTAPVTRVMVRTAPVMPVGSYGPVMAPIQALLRSRLEIGHTILGALAITWAVPITSGARDIGHGATVKGSGSTVTTL